MAGLSIRQLVKAYGSLEVLKRVSLEAKDGEFVVLVGPSGCGKSTLLATIAGLEGVSGGEIRIGSRLVNRVPPKDRNIAMVFQSYALYPTMTVRQNITFGMECRAVPKAEQREAVARVAALLQIDKFLDRKPAQLSGGQRQRVAMGRALVREPELFLFDEPLSNLDAKLRVEMRTEIKKLHQRLGTTMVYVTHDQVEAMTLASRIAVMHEGTIQQYAEPRTIYERPATMFVAGFMGSPSMNFLPARVEAENGGLALRLAADGTRLPLAADGRRGLDGRVGTEVVLGVRPENLVDEGRRPRESAAPLAIIDAPVEVVEPTGAETMVVIRLGGREVTARVDPDAARPPGSTMRFCLDMAKTCLFDPASGALL